VSPGFLIACSFASHRIGVHINLHLRQNVVKVIRSEFKKRYPDANPPLAGG
jgi:hypothetical protein